MIRELVFDFMCGEEVFVIEIVAVDLALPAHADAVLTMMSGYSLDAMGAGKALPEAVKAELIPRLRERADYLGVLAFEAA